MPANPRHLALETLATWTDLAHPPHIPERSEPASAWVGLTPRDRNLAYELITGVIRRRLLLDAVINSQLQMPPAELELKVRAILWLGVYQLLLHERAPSYATVHTAVELAKNAGRVRAAGLVNAVLRGVTRLKPTLEVRHSLSATTFPRDFSYQIRFNQPVFPDPSTNLIAHLAAVTSHPPELIKMLVDTYGGDDADALLRVVGPVAEGEPRRREPLRLPDRPARADGRASEQAERDLLDEERRDRREDRRHGEDDEDTEDPGDVAVADRAPFDRIDAGREEAGPHETPDERVVVEREILERAE
ncbi:MAG: transcription antitermination factor NusB, partial [Phycisphaerae bacterium]